MSLDTIPSSSEPNHGGTSNRRTAVIVLSVFALLSVGLLVAPMLLGIGAVSEEEQVEAADAMIRTALAASKGQYSNAELEELGERIERLIHKGEATDLRDHFDLDALLDTALEGLDPQNADVKEFREQLRQSLRIEPVIDQLLGIASAPSDTRFVGIRSRDGRKVLLFRFGAFDGLPIHIDLLVDRGTNGLMIVDGFMYPSGQFISEVARTMAGPLVLAEDRGAVSDEAKMGKVYRQIRAAQPILRLWSKVTSAVRSTC